jgi:poly(3-hydroxybutyrate) depolymerase
VVALSLAAAAAVEPAGAARAQDEPRWPDSVRRIEIRSTFDGAPQRAMFHSPGAGEPRPLLVALHTWSSGYDQRGSAPWAEEAIARGFVFIHPDFRGANDGPHAGGSDAALQDIRDAVAEARRLARVDARRIYLAGYSGGGHAALLVAAKSPGLFAAVSAWSPIVDLRAWHEESKARGMKRYVDDIEAICGGPPAPASRPAQECFRRSPLSFLEAFRGTPVDISTGIRDGHAPRVPSGTVPIAHAVRAFNALAARPDRVVDDLLLRMSRDAAVPREFAFSGTDASYGSRRILFRRVSGTVRLTLFDGDHEVVHPAAVAWLAAQRGGASR